MTKLLRGLTLRDATLIVIGPQIENILNEVGYNFR